MTVNPEYKDAKFTNIQHFEPCPQYPVCPSNPKLAHAYVPFQYLKCIYPPMKGLRQGTIFPELDRPYGLDPEYTVDA